jgi:hypothetical protein
MKAGIILIPAFLCVARPHEGSQTVTMWGDIWPGLSDLVIAEKCAAE